MESDDGNCNSCNAGLCNLILYKAYLRELIFFHRRAFLRSKRILS